ncbi:MAG TPA: hypothetical protein VF079_12085 [Sphingomicrobium sp.]
MLLIYRLYSIAGEHREIAAQSDAEAVALADSALADGPAELWCRNRLVRRWEPAPLPLFDWQS